MTATPILLLVGKAGSGKDTIADHLVATREATKIAFADPMKRLILNAWPAGPDRGQLWGPSARRAEPIAIDGLRKEMPAAFHGAIKSMLDRGSRALRLYHDWTRCLRSEIAEGNVLTTRFALQTLGTLGRRANPYLWSRTGVDTAFQILEGAGYTQVLGVHGRMDGPANLVVIADGRMRNEVLAVKRAGGRVVMVRRPVPSVGNHISETELDGIPGAWFDATIYNVGTTTQLYRAVDEAMTVLFHKRDFT